jgi:hypothetical protein
MFEDEPTELRLEHFKCTFDHTWDHPAIAQTLFPDSKRALVVLESLDKNAHTHFQGYTNLSEASFSKKLTELGNTHFKKKFKPSCRPVLRHKRKCDELGFQYMCKELGDQRDPLYSKGFTDDDLHALWSSSEALRDTLKEGLGDFLKSKTLKGATPKEMYNNLLMHASDYLIANDKKIGRHTKYNVLNAMHTHPQATPEIRLFAVSHA